MIIVGRERVEAFFASRKGHKGMPAARAQYEAWLAIASTADWRTPEDVKTSHPKASILKAGRVVFNIKGNDFRLIALVEYRAGVLTIRFFGIHDDYDRIDAETI
jgi:mRNA interferase HigB